MKSKKTAKLEKQFSENESCFIIKRLLRSFGVTKKQPIPKSQERHEGKMSEQGRTFLTPDTLPLPWELDEGVLGLLSVDPNAPRGYAKLSRAERMFLEGARLTIGQYEREDLLRDGKSAGAHLRELPHLIDRNWLRKERYLAFLATLRLLDAYAKYCAWAKGFKENGENPATLLDGVLLPYNGGISVLFQRGVLRLEVHGSGLRLYRKGTVRWKKITVSLSEMPLQEDASYDAFREDPLSCIALHHGRRTFGSIKANGETRHCGGILYHRDQELATALEIGDGRSVDRDAATWLHRVYELPEPKLIETILNRVIGVVQQEACQDWPRISIRITDEFKIFTAGR